MIKDYLKLAFKNLINRKMRSWLTIIGIFIGITAVVAIISLGQGLQVAINDQFSKLGNDKLFLQPGSGSIGGDSSVKLDSSDKKVIDQVSGVDSSAGWGYQSAKVTFKDQDIYVIVSGLPVRENKELIDEMYGAYDMVEGRSLDSGDNLKVVLGNDYVKNKKLFSKRVKLGDKIKINGYKLQVVGFYESFGNSADDSSVYMPKDAYEKVFDVDVDDDYNMIIIKTAKGADPSVVANNVKKALRNYHDLKEGDEDFTIKTTEELMDSFNSILNIINVVIIGIAAISLLVGGIGIMNTMYTSVLERITEIGVMKAIGAKNSNILFIFVIESGLLGAVGGAVGVIIGLSLSKATEFLGTMIIGTSYLRAWWSWELIFGAILFSFVIGALSGLTPAYKASKQKPVDSLRYE